MTPVNMARAGMEPAISEATLWAVVFTFLAVAVVATLAALAAPYVETCVARARSNAATRRARRARRAAVAAHRGEHGVAA